MSLDLFDGAVVYVEPPDVPEIRMEVPESAVVVIPLAGPRGAQGPSGSGVDVGQVKLTAIASATLSGHRAATSRPDGTLEYADNATLEHLHAPMWLTMGAASVGEEVEVLVYGTLTEPSWSWIPGGALYLGSSGIVTQAPPMAPALFSAMIGVATGPTTVFIDRQSSILLS